MPVHAAPAPARRRWTLVGAAAALGVVGAYVAADGDETEPEPERASAGASTTVGSPSTTTTPTTAPAPGNGWATDGLLTFRGSASRTYHGEGPVPSDPAVVWSYPGESGGLCAESTVGGETTTATRSCTRGHGTAPCT